MTLEKPPSAESFPKPTVELFNPATQKWSDVREDILELEKLCFGENAFDESSLEASFENPKSIVVTLNREKSIIGFSVGVPDRKDASAIHIYTIEIHPEEQGNGYVASILNALEEEARKRGYTFLTQHAMIENGYADKISKNYHDAIVETHDRDSEYGPQRFFKIAL